MHIRIDIQNGHLHVLQIVIAKVLLYQLFVLSYQELWSEQSFWATDPEDLYMINRRILHYVT